MCLCVGELDGGLHRVRDAGVLHVQPDGTHELKDFLDDGVGHLGFVDDVGQRRLRVGQVGDLPSQQAGLHFDAGERVLHLVGNGGGHLADGRQPVAQPFALLELFHPRQVLEEHRGADDRAFVIAHECQRVADDLARRAQAQFDAVRQKVQVEDCGQHPNDFGMFRQYLCSRTLQVRRVRRHAENAIGLFIDQGQSAVSRDGQHAVPYTGHDVTEERIADRRRRRHWLVRQRGFPRTGG